MSYIGNMPSSVAFLTDYFSGNNSTTAFTMSVAPNTTSAVLVSISGVLQDPTAYSVVGTTLTFSSAPPTGSSNIVARYMGIPASGVTTTAYRTVTEYTATSGQTTFSPPSYTVGYINVYRNGVRLGAADYTASNGTSVVLATGATVGDLITLESFYVSSVLNALPSTGGTINAVSGATPLIVQSNGTTVLSASTTSVGVGTSSPAKNLDVQSSSGDAVIRAKGTVGTLAGLVQADGNGTGSYPGFQLLQSGTAVWSMDLRGDTNLHLYRESGSGNVVIDSGSLCIGTTTPSAPLTVRNGSGSGSISIAAQSGGGGGSYFIMGNGDSGGTSGPNVIWSANRAINFGAGDSFTSASGGTLTGWAQLDSSGNFILGTTSNSGSRLEVNAADEVVSFNRSAATDGVILRLRKAAGTIAYFSTNTYSLPSDERVKKNIVDIGYGLDFVNSLRPVEYNTIFQDPANESKKNFGLIAQEVEEALDNMGKSTDDVTFLEKIVPENDSDSRYGLGYQNLVPVLIKAIQELKTIVETQAEQIAALQAKVGE